MACVTDSRGPTAPVDPGDGDQAVLVRDSLMRALIASDMNDELAAISAVRFGATGLIPDDALAISVIKQAHAVAERASQHLYGEPLAIAELRYTNATRRILQDAVWMADQAAGG